VVFDVDVKGAISIKKTFPDHTFTIFIKPPSPEVLYQRLSRRKSESEDNLRKRIEKAAYELTFEKNFDIALVNDKLERALHEAEQIVEKWLDS
jgi:guanylate kinase